MKKLISKYTLVVLSMAFLVVACTESSIPTEPTNQNETVLAKKGGFVHGAVINIDGEDYYFAGPADGPNGEKDVPGHYWVQAGPNQVVGKHYNSGPIMMDTPLPQWWSSDAPDGEYLYKVHGIIDTWSLEKAASYKKRGYVHRHEFVSVATGEEHPTKVIWFKHTARTSFTLDRGPMGQDPNNPPPPYFHEVTPGVDYQFPNNGMMEP